MALFGRPNVGKLRARGDVDGLVKASEHKDPRVREAAMEALADLHWTAIHGQTLLRARLRAMGENVPPEDDTGERVYAGPPLHELSLDDLVVQLERLGLTRLEAEANVRAAYVHFPFLRDEINESIYLSEEPLTAKNLAMKWRAHGWYHHSASSPRNR